MRLQYAAVFEEAPDGYGIFVPDVPGCISGGDTMEEARAMIAEALAFHIESLVEGGDPVPPTTLNPKEALEWCERELDFELPPEFGEADEALSTHVEMIEVEINLPKTVSR